MMLIHYVECIKTRDVELVQSNTGVCAGDKQSCGIMTPWLSQACALKKWPHF